jgi:hypothetical protein
MAREVSRKPASRKGTAGKAAGPAKAKASTSYSPAPMSAAAKKKAAKDGKFVSAYSKAKQAPAKRGAKAGTSTVSKVVKRAKTTAREARDVVTAVGTVGNAAYNTVTNKTNPFKATVTSKKNIAGSVKNLAKQVKETRTAALTGKKGTTSAQSGGRARGPKYTTNSGGSFQERELKTGKKRK